jgi:hypothetical protein
LTTFGQTELATPEALLFGTRFGVIVADATDGADGIIERRADPDDSISCSAFTVKGDVDANRPKKRLRLTQVAGKGARGFLGQPVLSLVCLVRSPTLRRSAALPAHEPRSLTSCRTHVVTGSASMMASNAVLRFAA